MQISKHFTKEELERSNTAIRLGLPNVCPDTLVPNLELTASRMELVRQHYDKPVKVLSCYRSPIVNSTVGGSITSAHRFGLAMDFVIEGVSNLEICEWASENLTDYDQIIYEFGEQGWVHIGFSKETPRKELLTAIKVSNRTKYLNGFQIA